MEPTDLVWQMMDFMPPVDKSDSTFMALLLLRLHWEMRGLLISKDFKACTLMTEYADLLYSSRACCSIAGVQPQVRGGH